ncbi:MAG: cysteine--tRNA ligase [Candidatus Latescibacteria bacterium]|jgi:cysteinyl-tRNA synthetase|nr:cysteine--tRNA ligase [Candidatus Latescibacterota bacterium]
MLQLFNTMSRSKETFTPLNGKEVRLYSCGPTVYNNAHIGNLSTYVVVDLFKRYLSYRGYSLLHVMNLTDVDDKTIRASRNEGVPLAELTQRYTAGFMKDLESLNIGHADNYTAATEHIDDMISLIETLVEKGFAYESEGSVYYKIAMFPEYGKLAGLDLEGMLDGARVDNDEYAKESARDFALWKAWTEEDGDVFWESSWGRGRPGWHVECSAMAMKYLGETFDVHTGAVDLIFPHHQNEIAQSEAATGKPYVKYWLHREFLNIGGSKMAKSTGNMSTLSEIGRTPADIKAFRYLVVATHYRTGLNFTEEVLEAAKSTMRRLTNLLDRLETVDSSGGAAQVSDSIVRTRQLFIEHMDDDLNTARAVADMFELVQETEGWLSQGALTTESATALYDFFQELNQVLGIFYTLPEEEGEVSLSEDLADLIQRREQARKNRDWSEADQLRDELLAEGIAIKDTAKGTEWERV